MTLRPADIFSGFLSSARGLAAVEFALVMPVLVTLFLGSYDAANAIALYVKVRAATYSLAAITNQYGIGKASISTATMTAITAATNKILSPYPSSPTGVVISQIKANSNTAAVVSWSYATGTGTALTQGSSFTSLPTNFASNTCGGSYPCYLIYAQVSYSYTPTFGAFMGSINMSDSLFTTPRISTCVQYNSVPSIC